MRFGCSAVSQVEYEPLAATFVCQSNHLPLVQQQLHVACLPYGCPDWMPPHLSSASLHTYSALQNQRYVPQRTPSNPIRQSNHLPLVPLVQQQLFVACLPYGCPCLNASSLVFCIAYVQCASKPKAYATRHPFRPAICKHQLSIPRV